MRINAIETRYNGYRFRSRLEARWAVFFDTLGVKYEYEKEGYDLGDAGYYLPDFWLPDHKVFVEIKPRNDEPQIYQRFYFAGKIGKGDWRHSIVKDLRGIKGVPGDWFPIEIDAVHMYTGPFFIGCDHGCYHNNTTHGVGRGQEYTYCATTHDENSYLSSEHIISACRKSIGMSDVIFVWLDDATAYGTIWEMGYAHGIGKPVYLAMPKDQKLQDLWFPISCADKTGIFSSAKEAFDTWFPVPDELKKIEKLRSLGETVVLYGEPYMDKYSLWRVFWGSVYQPSPHDMGFSMGLSVCINDIKKGFNAARAARFEYGEMG